MRMKMKTRSALRIVRALSACILIAPLLSCSFFGIPDYELTVTVKDGVQGTPGSGKHSYKDLTTVEYDYNAVNYLHTVEVVYEGGRYEEDGSFIVYTNSTLEARLVDIRATWTLTINDDNNVAIVTPEITFSGADVLSGTFSDNRGLNGTWDGTSNKITITYADWENFVLSGTVFGMNGIWLNGEAIGSWSAVRKP
ncbi:MAG TPA: hypothetical protein VLQ89_01705 [Candidatus Binatia bacterium]|nr:hypothetical protein [Candidatus Binatia bacterium]